MAHTANLNRVFEILPAIPELHGGNKTTRRISKSVGCSGGNKSEEQPLKATRRRMALSLGSISLVGASGIGKSLADDNGFWLNGPIPLPSVDNKIANEETGTRSFLKKGVYIADIGAKGRQFRIYKYAFDLLAMGDMIGNDALFNYVRKYLRLKSTFMYYDFDKVISAASTEDKQPLIHLANRLFDTVEKLLDAVKDRNLARTESCYQDTTAILQEVMTRMA